MVTNPSHNVFIVSAKGLFFMSESKYVGHFRESDPFLNCVASTSLMSAKHVRMYQAVNFLFCFPCR